MTAAVLGALAGVGLIVMVLGLQKRPARDQQERLRDFRSRAASVELSSSASDTLVMAGLAAVLGFGAWYATGWVAAAVLGATAGVMGPIMWRAPRKRRAFTDEIEAYSQWTEQVRDLVAASGSLFEAVTCRPTRRRRSCVPTLCRWRRSPGPWDCRLRWTGSPRRWTRPSPTGWCWA